MIWRRGCAALLSACLLAACLGDKPPAPTTVIETEAEPVLPPIARDRLGIAPKGGAEFDFLRDGYVFNQRGPDWANAELGKSGENFGDFGCTVTAVAMASSNLGKITDPGALNTALSDAGGYTSTGLLIWSALTDVSDGALVTDWHDEPTAEGIDACLKDQGGHPIVQFQWIGGMMHWVVVVGKDGTSWLIRDPLISTTDPIPLEKRAGSIRALRCVRPAT